MSRRTVRLATRASELAMRQTGMVIDALRRRHGDIGFEAVRIVSQGDRITDRPLYEVGGKDLFVKALEEAILAGKADCAVHSLKDMGAELDERFVIAGVLPRGDPRDVLVSRTGAALGELASGSVVGTSSPRRSALLRAERPDLKIVPVRGNIRTRLAKVGSEVDAAVLAAVGLLRLDLGDRIAECLGIDRFIPSPGQGTIAIECLAEDKDILALAAPVSCNATLAASQCERALAAWLGASCRTALGAYAHYENGRLSLRSFLANPDDDSIIGASGSGDGSRPVEIGEQVAQALLDQGGKAVVDGLRPSPDRR